MDCGERTKMLGGGWSELNGIQQDFDMLFSNERESHRKRGESMMALAELLVIDS
jgi:hypothetical protein